MKKNFRICLKQAIGIAYAELGTMPEFSTEYDAETFLGDHILDFTEKYGTYSVFIILPEYQSI